MYYQLPSSGPSKEHARHVVTACIAYSCTLQPVASTSHISSVAMISMRALCVVSTGLDIFIHRISSSSFSALPIILTNWRSDAAVVLRRPTARLNPGVCLSVCPFPRQLNPSHLPSTYYFSAASRSASPGRFYCASASPRLPPPARQISQISNICHLHDWLDCPRETRHSSCRLSVRDMIASTSVSSL